MLSKKKIRFKKKLSLFCYWIQTTYTISDPYIRNRRIVFLRIFTDYIVKATFWHVFFLSMTQAEKKNMISFTQILLSQSELTPSSALGFKKVASFAKVSENPLKFESIFSILFLLSFCLQNYEKVTLILNYVVKAFKKFLLFLIRKSIIWLKGKEEMILGLETKNHQFKQ